MSGTDQHDDLLRRASAALRDQTRADAARAGSTRARLLESAARRSLSRRRRWLRWLLGTGSLFVVGTALARVPDYAPRLLAVLRPGAVSDETSRRRSLRRAPTKRPASAPAQGSVVAATAVPTPDLEAGDPGAAVPGATVQAAETAAERGLIDPPSAAAVVPPPVEAEVFVPAHASRPDTRAHTVSSSPGEAVARAPNARSVARASVAVRSHELPMAAVAAPESTTSSGIAAAELELFRRAERLHRVFDPRALDAWDAYLRLAEHGVLVPEARYNRALCLVRLGGKVAAREALAPFARGVYGSYRRQEAEALLEALGSSR
jgi:hypothetical protein